MNQNHHNAKQLIPVIVLDQLEHAEPLAEALLSGGLNHIELTFRTDAAAKAIPLIKKAFPHMILGAGTVVTETQAKQTIDAGADFAVAPGLDPETINIFNQANVPFYPGIASPSDIQLAMKLGCRKLKYFPAEQLGGVKYLKAIAAPYRSYGLQFCPTGGLTLDNIQPYLDMDEVFALGGTWVAPQKLIANQDWQTITENATIAAAKMKETA